MRWKASKTEKSSNVNSQGFWLQGYLPMEILYFNKKMGMQPHQ